MVFSHHPLCRRVAGGAGGAAALARQGAAHATQLDRTLRRRAYPVPHRGPRRGAGGLHDPSRYAVRRVLLRALAQSPVGDIARRIRFRARRLHRRVQPGRRRRARHRSRRQARLRYRAQGPASVRRGPHAAALRRELRAYGLRHRGDLRLSGPRPARPRFRAQPGFARDSRGVSSGRGCGRSRNRRRGLCRRWNGHQFRLPRRALGGRRQGARHRRAGRTRRRRCGGQPPPAGLVDFAAALLGLPHSGGPLLIVRRGACAARGAAGALAGGRDLRHAGQPPGPPSRLEAHHVPALRCPRAAGHRHDGYLRRLLLVLRAFLRGPCR